MSTGQGLLSNNMFTYCGNNPGNCYDPTGNAYQGIYSQINYNEHDHTYGGLRENIYTLPEETAVNKVANYLANQDESVVLNAEYFAFYKGILVVRTNMDRSGSFGMIFLARNTNYLVHPEDMVRHEYGHVVQLAQLGLVKYALCIFLPSWQEWSSSPYYDRPWEVTADIYGGVKNRKPSQDVIEAGMLYLNRSSTWGPCVWFTID